MVKQKLARAATIAALTLAPLGIAGTAHASGSECSGLEDAGNASFNLCTYVNNSGGDGLYINYANVYVDTSETGWTFPNGQNCQVQPALTLWTGSGFSTDTAKNYACDTFQQDPSYTFSLHKEQAAGTREACATLFFPQYNQRVGYNDDCVGMHK